MHTWHMGVNGFVYSVLQVFGLQCDAAVCGVSCKYIVFVIYHCHFWTETIKMAKIIYIYIYIYIYQ